MDCFHNIAGDGMCSMGQAGLDKIYHDFLCEKLLCINYKYSRRIGSLVSTWHSVWHIRIAREMRRLFKTGWASSRI